MPEFLKLLAGGISGSNNKANVFVNGLRFVYVSTGGIIVIAWYSGWRNERIEPGSFKFPFPGVSKLSRNYPINREEKGLAEAPEGPQHKEFGTSVDPNGTKLSSNPSTTTTGGRTAALPQTTKEASKLAGLAVFDGQQVCRWIIPYLQYARNHGWKGHVESGYRSEAEQRRIYNSGVRPAAVPGTSNHEGQAFPRGAVDVTEAPQLSAILLKIPGGSLLKWAGSADSVHFSYPHNGGY